MVNMQRPLRILQVSTSDLGGGAEGSAWNLFQAYRARGHQSWLAVGYKRSDDPGALVIPNDSHRSRWARVWLLGGTSLELRVGRIRGVARLRNVLRWIGEPHHWLEKQRGYEDFHFPGTWHLLDLTPKPPDIVHCHNLHGDYFDLRALPWLSYQVPVILNLRDAWLLSGHCAHSFDCERLKIGCGQCSYLTTYPAIRRDATAYNWQRKKDIYARSRLYITAPSQWLMDKVQQSILQGAKYRVIPNGIDLATFCPGNQQEARSVLGLSLQAKIVLFVAHNPFKDYVTMEDALRRLDMPTDGTELLFICLGKLGAEQYLGQGRIKFVGFERDQKRVALYYQAADVYIHAATAEAFGKTVVEALACGLPVVATDVGGIPENIEDGYTGFLVPQGDAEAIANRLAQLLKDESLRRQFGERGVNVARHRFDFNRQADDFLNWYQEIIADWQDYRANTMNI